MGASGPGIALPVAVAAPSTRRTEADSTDNAAVRPYLLKLGYARGDRTMLSPTQARALFSRSTLLSAALLLGACSGEVSAPVATPAATLQAKSMFVPSDASKALIGVTDGTYSVTVDPTQDQTFALGPNHLEIPAYAICNLGTTRYGVAFWDKNCRPETRPLKLTVVIKGASSSHPSIDFFPAMRFHPNKTVQLFMYAPNVTPTDAKNWLMSYCPDLGGCFDESLTDASLSTVIDYKSDMLFRRVKHFSGYTVAERSDDGSINSGQ